MATRFERHLMVADGTMTKVPLLAPKFALAFARGSPWHGFGSHRDAFRVVGCATAIPAVIESEGQRS